MVEQFLCRLKVGVFIALFLSPVIVSAWSRSLDRWLEANHRFEALPGAQLSHSSDSGITSPENG